MNVPMPTFTERPTEPPPPSPVAVRTKVDESILTDEERGTLAGLEGRDRARAIGRIRKAREKATAGLTGAAKVLPQAAADEAQVQELASKAAQVLGGSLRPGHMIDGTTEYRLVPIDDIKPDPTQPRKTFRMIGELAQSIEQEGLGQPIVLRVSADDQLVIMYGERRWRAMRQLKWAHVPALIRHGVKDTSVKAKQLIENVQREDMDPMEEAEAIRAFMHERKIATYAEAATILGKSLPWVTGRIALLDLTKEDRQRVSSGELKLLEAVALSRRQSGKARAPRRLSTTTDEGEDDARPSLSTGHFSDSHPLAPRARARCRTGDPKSHRPKVGGVACGGCWEVVIRLDARAHPNALSATG
jgi:ParB/RepB/Spo0J family partition protein